MLDPREEVRGEDFGGHRHSRRELESAASLGPGDSGFDIKGLGAGGVTGVGGVVLDIRRTSSFVSYLGALCEIGPLHLLICSSATDLLLSVAPSFCLAHECGEASPLKVVIYAINEVSEVFVLAYQPVDR